jgi:hypothetical protein
MVASTISNDKTQNPKGVLIARMIPTRRSADFEFSAGGMRKNVMKRTVIEKPRIAPAKSPKTSGGP